MSPCFFVFINWCRLRELNPRGSKERPGYSRMNAVVHNLQKWRIVRESSPHPFQEPSFSRRVAEASAGRSKNLPQSLRPHFLSGLEEVCSVTLNPGKSLEDPLAVQHQNGG